MSFRFIVEYSKPSADADVKARAIARLFEAFDAENRCHLAEVLDTALRIRGDWPDTPHVVFLGYDYDLQSWMDVQINRDAIPPA